MTLNLAVILISYKTKNKVLKLIVRYKKIN